MAHARRVGGDVPEKAERVPREHGGHGGRAAARAAGQVRAVLQRRPHAGAAPRRSPPALPLTPGAAQLVLRLLFNLSFNRAARELILKAGLLPKLVCARVTAPPTLGCVHNGGARLPRQVELLRRPPFRAVTLRLLYHVRCLRPSIRSCSAGAALADAVASLARGTAWMTAARAC